MSISVANIKTAYVALGLLVTAVTTAEAAIVSLGARPTYPVDVILDADYNDVTTAIAAWDASIITLTATLKAAQVAQATGELAVTSIMPPAQWVKLTTLTNWGAAVTQYIGVKNGQTSTADNATGANLLTIITSSVLPTQAFPLV